MCTGCGEHLDVFCALLALSISIHSGSVRLLCLQGELQYFIGVQLDASAWDSMGDQAPLAPPQTKAAQKSIVSSCTSGEAVLADFRIVVGGGLVEPHDNLSQDLDVIWLFILCVVPPTLHLSQLLFR